MIADADVEPVKVVPKEGATAFQQAKDNRFGRGNIGKCHERVHHRDEGLVDAKDAARKTGPRAAGESNDLVRDLVARDLDD